MRVQVLELPTKVCGEFVETPFALVFDQVTSELYDGTNLLSGLKGIAREAGAVTAIVTVETVEVA